MRITIRVKPGASRTKVGGRYGEDALIVAVTAPAVDGRANDAVIAALADAFDVHRRDITIASGHTGRTKIVEISSSDEARIAATWKLLLPLMDSNHQPCD